MHHRPVLILLSILWAVAAASLGTLVVVLGYELIVWQDRQSHLDIRAGLVVARAEQIAMDARASIRAIARLKTVPCSPEDLAELRIIAARTTHILDVGRFHDGRVICEGARGMALGTVLPAGSIRRESGSAFWPEVRLFDDPRVHVAASARDGAVVFSRPRAADDLLVDLDRSVVTASTKAGAVLFRRSGPAGKLVGAEFAAGSRPGFWRDHVVRTCATLSDFCVDIVEPAPPALTVTGTTTRAGLLAGGLAIGFGGLSAVWSRNAAHRSMPRRLARAIRKDHIHVHYQPLVRLSDRRLVGFEALARWSPATGGSVSPEVFIPLAERAGLLPALTERVVSRCLEEIGPMLAGPDDLYLSINIGVSSLFDRELPLLLDLHCRRNGVDRSRIALEITERDTGDMDRIAVAINEFRKAGYRVFLDDFGTGYSSLAYLATLPIDTIKLDKLFTRLPDSALVPALVLRQISAIAATLDLTVVFEGVETEEQAKALHELTPGAIAQGWLFGRPMSAGDALAFSRA